MRHTSADAISGTSEPGKRWAKACGSWRDRLNTIPDTRLHTPVWRTRNLSLLDDAYLPTRAATAQARQWAAKAITIDGAFAEPHSSLGHAHYHEFEWTEAEREFRRSIALNPNYPSAHFYYALYLVAMARYEEAIAEAKKALALDPVSLAAQTNVAIIYYRAGRYDEAVAEARRVLDLETTYAHAHFVLGRAYTQNRVDTNTPLGFVGVGAMGSRIIRGLLAAIGVWQHCSDAILWRKLRQKPRWVRCLAILGLCLFVKAGLQAQTPDPTPLDAPQPGVRPPLSPFPRFEDWGFLRDPSLRVDPYDRLKFVPLNESKTNYLTFGLESRTEFQYLSNNNWGAGPQNPGVVLERLMPDIDLRLGDHARVFVTLFFDEFTGQYPRPGIDKDIADGHEGFVEFGSNLHDPHPGWDVIAGRQEIVLGTGRLLDDNEGVNVRSAFDGVRVGYDKPKGRIDLIAVKPVEINPGAWDDTPNPTITLWGLYASNLRWSPQFMSDVYFLDYDAKSAMYGNQSAREQRRTIAGRYFNRLPGEPPRAGFDYNVETGFQWGSFGNRSIRAWGAGGNIGWTLPGPIWRARFGLQADALSGDQGQPGTLGTFNALFPRGAYFGPKFALIGPANLLAVQPQFWFHPLQNVTGDLCWIWFWRESTNDALYSFENVQLRPANLSNERYIGSQPNLEIRWAISEHFLAALNLAGSMPGTFLQQSPPSKEIVFVNIGLTYRF